MYWGIWPSYPRHHWINQELFQLYIDLKWHPILLSWNTASCTGWSDVFAVITLGWRSLPNPSNKTPHATSMYIKGWHKERWSEELVKWQVSNQVWTESFNSIRLWRSINFLTTFQCSFSWLALHKWLWPLKSPNIKQRGEKLLIILSNASSLSN